MSVVCIFRSHDEAVLIVMIGGYMMPPKVLKVKEGLSAFVNFLVSLF